METPASSQVNLLTCYHCGDVCKDKPVMIDNHPFCCEGCRLVYELLKENNLCNYYDITRSPGHAAENEKNRAAYASLDDASVREKIVRFEDEYISRVTFSVPVMHCSSCIWLLEHLPKLKPGIISSTVNFPRKEVTVDFEKEKVKLSEIAALMASTGYAPSISLGDLELTEKKRRFNPRVLKIGVAGFCFGNIMMLSFPEYLSTGDLTEVPWLRPFFGWLSLALALPVLLYSASDFFVSAWKAIRYRSLNIDAPIALAVGVTFLRSVVEIILNSGTSYLDSMSGIVFFMLLGRYFQDRTYDNLSFERDYRSYFPIAVSVREGENERSVPVTRLEPGQHIIIRSGELIPADAILLSEQADIDYSFVTGEAAPVEKYKGDKIFAGARQTEGAIELEVVQATSQSYLTQLWNNDVFSKRREEAHKTYIDKINRWFTAGVLLVAFGAAAAWFFVDKATAWNVLTAVLIVACPCTLLLASTFTNGNVLRWLGRQGFFLKNASVIDRIATADTILFDKTGTITSNQEIDVAFDGTPLTEEEKAAVIALASQSGHPLSRRIAKAFASTEKAPLIRNVYEVRGKGLSGVMDGKTYLLGSADFAAAGLKMMKMGSEVWLAIDGKVRGRFVMHNRYREGLPDLVSALGKKFRIGLLSGDNDVEKENLRPTFDGNMFFDQSPQDKLNHIRSLQSSGRKVIMIGDGLNDAGALAQANAGIAVSDDMNNYFPACDAILDGKNFDRLPALISFTRVARRVVIISFVLSAIYNLTGIFYSVRGELSPLIAAVLMPASTFTVILVTTLSVRFAARRFFHRSLMKITRKV